MLIFGGIVGFLVCFRWIAVPIAAAMAAQLGVPLVVPGIGVIALPVGGINILIATLINIVLVLIAYIMVSVATLPAATGATGAITAPPPLDLLELFARGAMIGTNACFSLVVLPIGVPWLWALVNFSPAMGVALALATAGPLAMTAVAVCLINLGALIPALCANRVFAAFLGWSAWIAPGAWAANFVGLLFLMISIFAAVFFGVPLRLGFEWWTGSVIVHGGPLHVATPPTAYDLGNILFIDPRIARTTPILTTRGTPPVTVISGWTADGLTFHETGHTLNVAAFGSWFHYIGAIHELIPPPAGAGLAAYSELLPEGHLRQATRPWFRLWDPPVTTLTGTTSNAPPTVAGVTANGILSTLAVAPQVIPAGTTLVLAGGTPSDPDAFPLAAVNPGLTPNVGVLWAFSTTPAGSSAAVVAPNSTATTANVDIGGDYTLIYAVTDGMALDSGIELPTPAAMPNFFLIRVVQAVVTVPPAATVLGAAGTPIPISAAGSTAGTAGALAGTTIVPPPPVLAVNWVVAPDPTDPLGAGAVITIADNTAADTTFTADRAATYQVTLTVTTAGGVSHAAIATVIL